MPADARETIPVREAHRFDVARLEAWLAGKVELARPLAVEQMSGGVSNPTFLLRDARGHEWVLRKQPPGKLLPSAHAMDREFRAIRALKPAGVPVPEAIAYSDDRELIGTPFYVMERMRGRIFRRNELPDAPPAERRAIYAGMADALAALHAVDPAAVGLGDFGRAGDYYARQTKRWAEQWRASKLRELPALDFLVEWLPANLPDDGDEARVSHGDFRFDNLVFDAREPRVIAILDWELATIGPPLADVAYSCFPWRMREDALSGLAGKDLAALALPAEKEYLARYLEKSGRREGPKPFHYAFAMFRVAAILEGVLARARAVNASTEAAEAMGRLGERFAIRGREIAEGKG